MKFGKILFSHWDWGRYSDQKTQSENHIGTEADIPTKIRSGKITASALNPFSELLPNLYYSPIKKLENVFIFKIARQQHP